MTRPILAFDTSGPRLSVGVWQAGTVLWERAWDFPPGRLGHAAQLVPAIAEGLAASSLTLADLACVAFTIGPGSYTGLRIGLATAKGLALATGDRRPPAEAGLPLVGVGTLEAMAVPALAPGRLVLAWIDARRGEAYAAAYRWREGGLPEEVLAPVRRPLGDLRAEARQLSDRLGLAEVREATAPPTVAAIARLAAERLRREGPDDPLRLVPVYVSAVHTGPVPGVAKA